MKTTCLGIDIERFEGGKIVVTEPIHFSPYLQHTRHLSTVILPEEMLVPRIAGPLYAGKATDDEIVAWWLASSGRRALLEAGAPE